MAARPLRILLVDDHADTVQVLARLIEMNGHEATMAGSVADAARSALAAPPDVLISDLDLTGGDGCELLRRIRTFHPAVRGIAASGHAEAKYEAACREAGYETLLTKPVELPKLLSLLAPRSAAH